MLAEETGIMIEDILEVF